LLKMLHNNNHRDQGFIDGITKLLEEHPEILAALKSLLRVK